MALTTPVALTAVATGTAITLTSAAYTPTANGIQFVYIAATGSVNGQTLNSVASTHSGTGAWTVVKFTPGSLSQCLAAVAWAVTGPSPGSGTFTATFNAASADNELLVCETTGQDPVTPVSGQDAQGAATTTTTPVLTLSVAPTLADMPVVCFAGRNVGANPGVPSGSGSYVSLGANNHVNPCASIIGAYCLNSTAAGITPSGMGTVSNAGAAIVIKAAAAVPVIPAQAATPGRTWLRKFKHRQILPQDSPVATNVAVSLAETGTGVDALSATATVPLTDTASGADALSANATVPLTEAASGNDALSVAASTTLSDSATGVDAISVTATVALTDTGTGTETISVGIPQVLPGETGTGVDAISITTTVPLTDTSTGADALTLTATVPLSDPRPVTDALSLTATVPLTETGTGTDAIAVSRSLFLTDTGTGVDALSANATLSLTEVSSGVDAISVITGSTPVALTEDVGSVESIAVLVTRDFYQFVSPLFTNDRAGSDRFWGQLTVTHSKSILKFGSSYVPIQGPTNEQIVAADITYLGGHIYTVSAAEAAALTAAGYGAGLS